MKSKFYLIILLFALLNSHLGAQSFGLCIKSAPVPIWSNYQYYSPLDFFALKGKHNISMHTLYFTYDLKSRLSFKTGLIYETKKTADTCSWLNVNDQNIYDCNFKDFHKVKNINIPIIVSYHFYESKKLIYHLDLGFILSYNLNIYRKLTDKRIEKEYINSFKQSGKHFIYTFGTGINYKLTPNIYLTSDVSYFFQNFHINDAHLINLSLGMGYCFNVPKK